MVQVYMVFGPSGVGKSSIVSAALANDACARVRQVVTCTTRNPRFGEVDGEHYYFVGENVFEEFISQGLLIEWSKVYGSYYGVLRQSVFDLLAQGLSVVMLLDRAGVQACKKVFPEACTVFLFPPSLEVLCDRLVQRGTNSEESVRRRMALAEAELLAEKNDPLADICIENDDFEGAVAHIVSIFCKR